MGYEWIRRTGRIQCIPDKRHFWIEFRRLATNGSLFTYAVQACVPYIRNTLTYVITLQQQCGSTSNDSGEDNRGAGSAVVKGVVVRVMFRITAAMRYYRLWIYTCNTGKTQFLPWSWSTQEAWNEKVLGLSFQDF